MTRFPILTDRAIVYAIEKGYVIGMCEWSQRLINAATQYPWVINKVCLLALLSLCETICKSPLSPYSRSLYNLHFFDEVQCTHAGEWHFKFAFPSHDGPLVSNQGAVKLNHFTRQQNRSFLAYSRHNDTHLYLNMKLHTQGCPLPRSRIYTTYINCI